MRIAIKSFFVLIFTFFFSFGLKSQSADDKKDSIFKFHASYTGDLVSNFTGGIKQGTTYLGLINIKGELNTGFIKCWKGGSFLVNIANTHGGQPSKTLVGDFQGVSNIEAGNLTFLYELYYSQTIGNVSFLIGLQDLNANFCTTENGALFTNSSFGIQSSIADNIPTPIFPLTALGFVLKYNISSSFLWQGAVFDGTPDDFETNPYNINWKLSEQQGFLAVSEFQLMKSVIPGKTGCYKFGVYYHQHNDTIDKQQRNGGIYFVGDQQITNKLSLFSQIGLSPKRMNKNNYYYSIGFNYKNVCNKRPNDQFGMAVALAGIDGNGIGIETAVELTYKWQINKNLYLRPDIQYIINPAGTSQRLENALVGFMRLGFDI